MLEIEVAALFPQRLMDEFPIDFKDSKTEQQIIAEDEAKKEAALRKQNVLYQCQSQCWGCYCIDLNFILYKPDSNWA